MYIKWLGNAHCLSLPGCFQLQHVRSCLQTAVPWLWLPRARCAHVGAPAQRHLSWTLGNVCPHPYHTIITPLPQHYNTLTTPLPYHYHTITVSFHSQGSAWPGVFLPTLSLWCHQAQLNSRSALLRMYLVAGNCDSVQTDRPVDRQSEHALSVPYSLLPLFCMQLQCHDMLYQKDINRLCTRTSLFLLPHLSASVFYTLYICMN